MKHAPLVVVLLMLAGSPGCMSPYHADRGALVGGLGGAGLGALVGHAVGATGPGAVIGAGVGALSGAAVGGALDDIEARNQAEIQRQVGRAFPQGTVTIEDVIEMTKAGVDPEVIAGHVRANGAVGPLDAQDLIFLKKNSVDPAVVQAMQAPRRGRRMVDDYDRPVVVEEHFYGGPCWYPPPPRYGCRPRSRVGWGVSVSSGF